MVDKKISGFFGEYRWLSNFWPAKIILGDITFPTVEHAYQAAKTLDLEWRRRISYLQNPARAKKIGRLSKLRDDWNEIKLQIMEDLIIQKFQILELKRKLLDTEDVTLIEENNWNDRFWGVCNKVGENHLGKILMKVREELK